MKIASLPATEATFDRFSVWLNGERTPVAAARVSAMPFNQCWPGYQRPLDQTEMAGFVRCESNEPVTVCVAAEDVREVCVRPLARHIAVEQRDGKLWFTLSGAGQYVLEVNGPHEALHIFVAPEAAFPKGTDVLYFGAGVHEIGIVELHDNQTVVLDAKAVVYGGFVAFHAQNITITGTGILDGSREMRTDGMRLIPSGAGGDFFTCEENLRHFIREHGVLNGSVRLYSCRNCRVEHITCRDAATFAVVPAGCEDVVIDDIKLIGHWRYNSDGVDFLNSRNCILQNSFLRNFDDCVCLKGINGWGHQNLENIRVENCVIWCDWGRGLEIGAETLAKEYKDIVFRNCDLIHGAWLHLDIQHHNDAHIHDVVFEDIRCEYTVHQQPLKFQSGEEQRYEEASVTLEQPQLLGAFFFDLGYFGAGHSGQHVERIVFRNIQILTDGSVPIPPCIFEGLDENNQVRNVVIEGLTLNGQPLERNAVSLQCNAYTKNITVL